MIGYGFGYDEEVPAGFQDADIEQRELEESAKEDRDDLIDDGRSDGYGESYAERNI